MHGFSVMSSCLFRPFCLLSHSTSFVALVSYAIAAEMSIYYLGKKIREQQHQHLSSLTVFFFFSFSGKPFYEESIVNVRTKTTIKELNEITFFCKRNANAHTHTHTEVICWLAGKVEVSISYLFVSPHLDPFHIFQGIFYSPQNNNKQWKGQFN